VDSTIRRKPCRFRRILANFRWRLSACGLITYLHQEPIQFHFPRLLYRRNFSIVIFCIHRVLLYFLCCNLIKENEYFERGRLHCSQTWLNWKNEADSNHFDDIDAIKELKSNSS
jgi:hypothetical protein